jgi:hypothetical protein
MKTVNGVIRDLVHVLNQAFFTFKMSLTLTVKFALEQAITAKRGSRGSIIEQHLQTQKGGLGFNNI